MTGKATKRVPLSEAIKKVGVRTAFGVTAVDLHRHERKNCIIEKLICLMKYSL
jgi:hypothetical protein